MAPISPDRSEPRVRGRGCGKALFPALIQPSHGPTPAASTLTRTSLGPGLGRGTRSNLMTLGGPNSCTSLVLIGLMNDAAGGHRMLLCTIIAISTSAPVRIVFGIDDEDSQ